MNKRPRRGSPTSDDAAQALLRDLRAFHGLAAGAHADPARLPNLGSPRLRASAWSPRFEAAWSLLRDFMTRTPSDDEDDEEVGPEAILALTHPFNEFCDYLERFPPGEALQSYRASRLSEILTWYPHVHPSTEALTSFAADPSPLAPPVVEAIRGHVFGPYCCLSCRRELTAQIGRPPSEAHGALAAAVPDEQATSWTARLEDREWMVRCFNDAGYLRVCLTTDDPREAPTTPIRATFFFASGQRLRGALRYPDHAIVGANVGKLGESTLTDLLGTSIEPQTHTTE